MRVFWRLIVLQMLTPLAKSLLFSGELRGSSQSVTHHATSTDLALCHKAQDAHPISSLTVSAKQQYPLDPVSVELVTIFHQLSSRFLFFFGPFCCMGIPRLMTVHDASGGGAGHCLSLSNTLFIILLKLLIMLLYRSGNVANWLFKIVF